MVWLFALPILLLLAGTAAVLPYAAFSAAARNTRHRDGRRSRSRTRREATHAAALVRDVVLAPLVMLLLLQGGLYSVHHYVVPEDTTLSDLFGDYFPEVSLHAPDLEAWEDAIAASRRDRAYADWQRAQGLLPAVPLLSSESLSAFFFDHWPLHPAFLLILGGFLGWHLRRRSLALAGDYHRGVAARARRFALHGALAHSAAPRERSRPAMAGSIRPRRRGC